MDPNVGHPPFRSLDERISRVNAERGSQVRYAIGNAIAALRQMLRLACLLANSILSTRARPIAFTARALRYAPMSA